VFYYYKVNYVDLRAILKVHILRRKLGLQINGAFCIDGHKFMSLIFIEGKRKRGNFICVAERY
jgi:hypothetical protein